MSSKETTIRSRDIGIFLWTLLNEQTLQFDQYQWSCESVRWYELVFCLLSEIVRDYIPRDKVRQATRLLVSLELLDVEVLAELGNTGKFPNGSPELKLMSDILQRTGFDAESTSIAVKTVCEAADSIQKQYDARPQRYLRYYGELMLNEIGNHFDFSSLSDNAVRRAFSLWFQNVLNMPVSASAPSVLQFCDRFHTSIDELIDAADRHGINLAIVDDLIEVYMESEETTEDESTLEGEP